MASPDPRSEALRILGRVERDAAYSGILLQRIPEGTFSARDLAFLTELVYGVLRRARSLDAAVASLSSRPLKRIDPEVLIVLRIGLYQILFMDRVPPHAAVNESVGLARRLRGRGRSAGPFVNAVLRSALRDRAAAAAAASGAGVQDDLERLAIAESHPEWLVRRWAGRFGASQAAALLAAQNRPAPIAARIRGGAEARSSVLEALVAEGVEARPSDLLDDFVRLRSGAVHRSKPFQEGSLYIQDEASGLVARLADVRPGDRVLDACAAPGGKSLAMAERAGESGFVVGCDVHAARAVMLRDNARRLGVRCLAVAADMTVPPFSDRSPFDVVLVDAPCSGTGVIRRNPELRDRVSQESLRRLAELQSSLLDAAASLTRPGGALVYAVCSLEEEEGPMQAEAFLSRHPRFAAEDARPVLPDASRGLVEDLPIGPCLVTRPDRDDLDGFFAVRFRRQRDGARRSTEDRLEEERSTSDRRPGSTETSTSHW